jgi:hypothetical protein
MDELQDVPQASSPAASDVTTQPATAPVPEVTEGTPTLPVGSKTPPENLYAALDEERRLRKEAEKREQEALAQINTSAQPDQWSDEGKAIIETYVAPLQKTVESLQEQLTLKDIYTQFPQIKELSSDFEAFKANYPTYKLEDVAKLFLSEKGLVSAPRKGLEKPTGGPRTPASTDTNEDLKNLRLNNPNKYREGLKKGTIKF